MKKNVFLVVALFLVAFGLRFYDISYPNFRWMDETGHVPAAVHYWNDGQFEPDNWEHPPLRPVILYGFLQLFGDNPYGWRMRNVLFGALAAVLTGLFAWEISGSRKTALMAGLLLATDPLHIVLSRFTFCEVYGGAFSLAAIVLYIKYANGCKKHVFSLCAGKGVNPASSSLKGGNGDGGDAACTADSNTHNILFVSSALFAGCALAIKWNFVPGWILVLILALLLNNNYRNFKSALFVVSVYLFIPLSVYIISFYPWFGRGYSFGEFVEFVTNIYYSFQLYIPQRYDQGLVFLSHVSAGEWFIRPIVVGQGTYLSADFGEFILFVNNLPIWILTIPSMIVLSVVAVRRKTIAVALPALFFCASYMLFLVFVRRPAFLYSTAPLLPFAFTAIAFMITKLSDRYGSRLFYAVLAVMVSWNLFLYPLVTAKKVPIALYSYIINNPDVKLH